MRVLVVEDDPVLGEAVVEVLRDASYATDLAADGDTADELLSVNDYDLVLLDWNLPGTSGIDLLAEWRSQGKQQPILMLTGNIEVQHRIDGLDSGADDYLTKPFSFEELLARVRSLLRRRAVPLRAELQAADLAMDRASHRVTVAGEVVSLSPKEFALLEYLLVRKGDVVSRTEISEHVWDEHFDPMSNTIDVILHRLRKKLGPASSGERIETVKGVGYRLCDPDPT